VQEVHAENGTRFALGRGVSRILGDSKARGVLLDDGATLDADVVIVGIGVRPATDFVTGVELDHDGGLPVDENLSAAPGVWAAGDVARYREPHTGRDVRIEHWRVAEQHGRAAAADIAGRGRPFAGVPFFWTQHFDLELGYAGAAQGWEEVVVSGDPAARDFTAFFCRDERILAACGTRRTEIGAFVELMRIGRVPAPAEVRGRAQAGLAGHLARDG
jgi:NADPH-dependent 2,4-dienoyl-CoA reductase/sulfur reductase-like enzyme